MKEPKKGALRERPKSEHISVPRECSEFAQSSSVSGKARGVVFVSRTGSRQIQQDTGNHDDRNVGCRSEWKLGVMGCVTTWKPGARAVGPSRAELEYMYICIRLIFGCLYEALMGGSPQLKGWGRLILSVAVASGNLTSLCTRAGI